MPPKPLDIAELIEQPVPRLLEMYKSEAINTGKVFQQYTSRSPSYWAAFRRMEKVEQALYLVLKLAGAKGAEINNRPVFIWLASMRVRARGCSVCGSRPPRGAKLNLWLADEYYEPTPLIMAHNNKSLEQVKAIAEVSKWFCPRCAKLKGGKLLANGQPDLQRYL